MKLSETTSTLLDQALQAFRASTGLSFEKRGVILTRLNRHSSRALLVADYVNPEMAGRLREADAQFINGFRADQSG